MNDITFEFKKSICGLYVFKIKTGGISIDLGTVYADNAVMFKKTLLDVIEYLDEIIATKE